MDFKEEAFVHGRMAVFWAKIITHKNVVSIQAFASNAGKFAIQKRPL